MNAHVRDTQKTAWRDRCVEEIRHNVWVMQALKQIRDICCLNAETPLKWFSKLMGEEPDLDLEVNREFFEAQILQLDSSFMTENGMKCFDHFFKAVNAKEGKLVARRKMNYVGLIGLDYLWRVILFGSDPVAEKYDDQYYRVPLIQLYLIMELFYSLLSRTIHLLKETYTSLGPRLVNNHVEIHEDLIISDRLRASHDTLRVYMMQQ